MTAPTLTGQGTPEAEWQAAGLPSQLPPLDLADLVPRSGRVVVLAPHPDDEVLGCGGTLALLAAAGCHLEVIAVTDGEASHPGRAEELRRTRHVERTQALRDLGLGNAGLQRLHLPDGEVTDEALVQHLQPLVSAGDLVLAPWEYDGHPDHDAVGRAAQTLATTLPAAVRSYLVWAWHWARPDDLPLVAAARIALPASTFQAKLAAAGRYVSQLEGPEPILPPWVLQRLLRRDEVLLPSTELS